MSPVSGGKLTSLCVADSGCWGGPLLGLLRHSTKLFRDGNPRCGKEACAAVFGFPKASPVKLHDYVLCNVENTSEIERGI